MLEVFKPTKFVTATIKTLCQPSLPTEYFTIQILGGHVTSRNSPNGEGGRREKAWKRGCVFSRNHHPFVVSRAYRPLNILQQLTLTIFPLATRCIFSRANNPLKDFPRFSPVQGFPTLTTRNMFSRICHTFHVILRL